MRIIYDEDYIPEEPCLSCEKCYVENIWNEYCCDEKHCIHEKEYQQALLDKQTYVDGYAVTGK